MGFGFDIGVEGEESLEGLQLALKNLPLHLSSEVHTNALKKAAKHVEWEIAGTVPVDTGLLESDLAMAFHSETHLCAFWLEMPPP